MCAGCGWITALVDARSKEGGYPRGAREVLLCVCGRQPCVAPLTTSGRRRERGGVPVQQRGGRLRRGSCRIVVGAIPRTLDNRL